MKRGTWALSVALLIAGGGAAFCSGAQAAERRLLAAPGVVEPYGEEREVASELIGRIQSVLVQENQSVTAGQVIAVIRDADWAAQAAGAKAILEVRRAELTRLLNGARPEERAELAAVVKQHEADRDYLRSELTRQASLARDGVSAQARLDQVRGELRAAEARVTAARERLAVIQAPAREDEAAAARARVAAAEADLAMAQANLDRTQIRSPIDGVVLRLERKPGEVVSNQPPTLIAVIGDMSRLRVRAEIDELDVGRVAVGQRVEATANAYPGQRFPGQIVQVGRRMGKKQIFTGRAADKLDNRSLQVLIDLAPGTLLPAGLTTDVFVLEGR